MPVHDRGYQAVGHQLGTSNGLSIFPRLGGFDMAESIPAVPREASSMPVTWEEIGMVFANGSLNQNPTRGWRREGGSALVCSWQGFQGVDDG